MPEQKFEKLLIIDPDLTDSLMSILQNKKISVHEAQLLEEETIWGMCQDIELGTLIARGYASLIGETGQERLDKYHEVLHVSCKKGLNLGRMIAVYWVPILRHGNSDIIARFPKLLLVMLKHGEYTLKKPLNTLASFLESGDTGTALAFMGLLHDTYSQDLPYKQSIYLARLLSESVGELPYEKRNWQISQIRRVIRTDFLLADPFINAMKKRLYLLSENSLRYFVSLGLDKFKKNESLGIKFLSLESKMGMDFYQELLVTISISQVQPQLNRYLKARTGLGISIRPLSVIPNSFYQSDIDDGAYFVCSDGKFIYLPDEISIFSNKDENLDLYKYLTKLEAAFYEFKTFDFDLEKALEKCRNSLVMEKNAGSLSDMERFFLLFDKPDLASDLFTVFEQGRIRILLKHFYPGIVRTAFPMLRHEARRMDRINTKPCFITRLYHHIGLGEKIDIKSMYYREIEDIKEYFEKNMDSETSVEACAEMVYRFYPLTKEIVYNPLNKNYTGLQTPFKRKIRPDLFYSSFFQVEQNAEKIKLQLRAKGLNAYKSDIKKQLTQKQAGISIEDLKEIVFSLNNDDSPDKTDINPGNIKIDLSWLDLSEILGTQYKDNLLEDSQDCPVFRYKEWDIDLGDYLYEHTRILDKIVPEIKGCFYDNALNQHYGLVRSIRRAFELLKPQSVKILRQWTEGDEFDYRALLDYAIDRKAGIMPSDRLYIKRIKQQRDVAVLLLVDLSKSTANPVFDSDFSVLDLEKQAIVLFCEALEVLGDNFAIAGFSGTGRLSVEYFHIKDFDEPVEDTVKARINAMSPQRSTRMGAAIRHASAQLEKTDAKVRILIILGDGFPNDTNYKREYAIADTRKAISEARAKSIHAKAITVNITGDSKLDDLYGSMHHNIISDVRELPDKLLRIYSALTK
ncbi:von Willebrand factor A-like domain-containing protein [Desulfonema limicola]|uniref:von Willebrand factor A-like domain-containing protein n=1 Tax=Desulfonema limicola TaxID=45656 RepID=A0A975GEG1_9BACT|nr:VWA domain-containing protein [Desulfonema limicola]QTA78206.1 von Willebrand factor A-like domain-containing protein [Desulfonema limicola]